MTRLRIGATAAMAAGIAGAAGALATGRTALLFACLDAAWLFFAGVAAGSVALSAAVRVAQGRWASAVQEAAEPASGFFLPAFVLLVLLVGAAPVWLPWTAAAPARAWPLLALRDLLPAALLFWTGRRYVRAVRAGTDPTALAIGYLALFAVTLSLWTFDLVIKLRDTEPLAVLPVFYFTGALLSGLAVSLLFAERSRPEGLGEKSRHDAGMLVLAMLTFWSYLLWSIFLPAWYGNLPEENETLLARWHGGWRIVTSAALLGVLAVPFPALLPEQGKKSRIVLPACAALIALGLLLDAHLLVLPSLACGADGAALPIAAAVCAGVGGLFLLARDFDFRRR